jgi:hypothetical protein
MSKVKHFQVKPEHVEAIQFNGKNGKDICDWIGLFAERYRVKASNGGTYIDILHVDSDVSWRATKNDWVVRSFINSYFYVEIDTVMIDQYIQL